jgi:NAD(P)-dependent dehydrogenase (short-subunit alcohol dehydrogenase family)
MRLIGKRILVTGASSGIGRSTCLAIAAEGGEVIALARRQELLASLVQEMNTPVNQSHNYFACDITDTNHLNNLVESIGQLDGIVHAAGIVFPLPLKFIQKKHLDKVWSINTFAPIELTGILLKHNLINSGSSIVFLSSISSQHPYFGGAIYVSSKAALEAYSRTVALELSPKHIRSNVISPALVKTAIFEQTMDASEKEKMAEYEAKYPFGFGLPEDVAHAILFFLSNDSRWITGQNLIMDGGLTLNAK